MKDRPATCPRFDPRRLERLVSVLQEKYLQTGRLPGFRLILATGHEVVLDHCAGSADVERKRPVESDTIFRIHSMSKPLTSLLLMMLIEEGRVGLDEPVHRLVPAFRRLRVSGALGSSDAPPALIPLSAPMRIVDLLRHTSGLSYAVQGDTSAANAHRDQRLGFRDGPTGDALLEALAEIPLDFSPGEAWNYSIATDVIGCIIERLADDDLPSVMEQRLLQPLGMTDTAFDVPPDKVSRFAACYGRSKAGLLELLDDPLRSSYLSSPRHASGGSGLVSTGPNYTRLCQLFLNDGAIEGESLISPSSVRRMRTNHLPGSSDLRELSRSLFSETTYTGVGFGLGLAVTLWPERTLMPGSAGDCFWGGMASCSFWIDPREGFACTFLTQLIPSDAYPLRRTLRELVYAALQAQ